MRRAFSGTGQSRPLVSILNSLGGPYKANAAIVLRRERFGERICGRNAKAVLRNLIATCKAIDSTRV